MNICPYCDRDREEVNDHIKLNHMHWRHPNIRPYQQHSGGITGFAREFAKMLKEQEDEKK